MDKLVIIGIDGFDKIMLSKFANCMPTFREIKLHSKEIKLHSVFPSDSETAWASIYTGLNPAKTGVVNFKNPLDKKKSWDKSVQEKLIYKYLHGNTFWDICSKNNKKVCIVFPHAIYPSWEVNGIMLCRSMNDNAGGNPPVAFPEYYLIGNDLNEFNTLRNLPKKRELKNTIKKCEKLIKNELKLGIRLLLSEKWNLFFIYSSTLDYIQHIFWNYYDHQDPMYPGKNDFEDVILNFYILYDQFVGEIISVLKNIPVIILSDHGHGMRPTKLVNINKILKNYGLLVPKVNKSNKYYLNKKIKDILSDLIRKYELVDIAKKIIKIFPMTKTALYTSPLSIDWDKTIACVTDPSGIKAYNYGGIFINKSYLNNDQYEELRDDIIGIMLNLKLSSNGESIVNWAAKREKVYSGKYLSLYPDILFELDEDYGVGWDIYEPLMYPSKTHFIQPGGHKRYSPVCYFKNIDRELSSTATLMDIAPTVLDLLGVKFDKKIDGRSLCLD